MIIGTCWIRIEIFAGISGERGHIFVLRLLPIVCLKDEIVLDTITCQLAVGSKCFFYYFVNSKPELAKKQILTLDYHCFEQTGKKQLKKMSQKRGHANKYDQ